MGGFISSFFWSPPKRTLLLGLGRAGKTTILQNVKSGAGSAMENPAPTSVNMETIEFGGFSFDIWEIGGGPRVRPLWEHYFDRMEVFIFVIDAADLENLEESIRHLKMILTNEKLNNAKILIFANKIDLPEAVSAKRIEEMMGLDNEASTRIKVQECCALSTNGFEEGFTWLIQDDLAKKYLPF